MGIYVNLNIIPTKVREEVWLETYKEAEELINSYPFLDIVWDNDTYDCSWSYADNPGESPIKYCNSNLGFRMSGDLVTLETAESFELIRDLNYYRNKAATKSSAKLECQDILQFYINHLDGTASVFQDKTQGYDYHRYILAIACLFEDRLNPYALVSGDISRGQMESAVEWVNGILKKPVRISDRANNEKLLARTSKIGIDELEALNIFMATTINKKNYQLGCFIRENFSEESTAKYYAKKISEYKIGTFGFSDILTEYLNLGNDLTILCDLCINKDSDSDSIKLFIKSLFKLGMHLKFEDPVREQQKQLEQLSLLQTDDPCTTAPDTINSMFGKLSSKIMHSNVHQSNMYISLDTLVKILQEKFGSHCDVDALVTAYAPDITQKLEISPTKFSAKHEICKNEIIEKYDIEKLNDLIFWQPGLTICPELEKYILHVKKFIEKDIFQNVEVELRKLYTSDQKDRMRYLITHNRHFLITKKNWNYIEKQINDFNFFSKIACTLLIDAKGININRLCLSLLNNTMLWEKFILETTEILLKDTQQLLAEFNKGEGVV